MNTSAEGIYLDSSAIVKTVVHEADSVALTRYLEDHAPWYSCTVARVEVVRAVRVGGTDAVVRARAVLAHLDLIQIDDALLDSASSLDPHILRSLDALHLAAAHVAGVQEVVTYDRRMAAAAESLGFRAVAPGQEP